MKNENGTEAKQECEPAEAAAGGAEEGTKEHHDKQKTQ
jgi:hypothetical protein